MAENTVAENTARSPMTPTEELFEGSADSWTDHPDHANPIPPELSQAAHANLWQLLTGFLRRHAIRRDMATRGYANSRNPARGLPIASDSTVSRFLGRMIRDRRGLVTGLIVVNCLAAVAGAIVPQILGSLVDDVTDTSASRPGSNVLDTITAISWAVMGLIAIQALLTFLARRLTAVFGQDMVASAREYVIRAVLKLPLSRVETASTGDLVTRVTRDVSAMGGMVRWAMPTFVIGVVSLVVTMIGMVVNSWLLALPLILTLTVVGWALRSYLRLAPAGYITEGAAYSQLNTSLTESVEGARSVEALGLSAQRIAQTDHDIEMASQNERYTMMLRAKLFTWQGLAQQLPMAAVVVLGFIGYAHGLVTLGQVTAATVYLQQMNGPIDRIIMTINNIQVGVSSTSRLLGIASVPADREPTDETPSDEHLVGKDLTFAYRAGRDVLHDVTLDLRPGERLAIVGPSGSGKSTLGRLLAGINAPREGVVTVGGVDVMHLPLSQLRTQVALVTQEHHVFVGSIRDNVILAREDTTDDEQVWSALAAVEAEDWVRRMPDGLDTMVGSGRTPLTPGQAQQIALARLVIADPHTLVLDEATSLIDPTTARHVEGSMSALLTGRTVVAIAHRLHTAHDAERIAVVIDGRVAELGSHEELMALQGEYARLWVAWTT
ncbi:MAG: ABC transporter ATP-binding protein/permease [Propionibacteriaceae bacterium]|jgi:ABC-type multidrug transport system fused ATPase/permease subunit|nr:ABC transporter ATP-binding protein/permease [Propionibacteriaceae bacterium]